MMDLKTIIRAARHHEPLKEELGPVQNIVFEMAQGPANAPMAWGAIAAAVVALVFVGITRLSVPSSIQVVSEPSGAEVMVDGVNKGVTPLTVKSKTQVPFAWATTWMLLHSPWILLSRFSGTQRNCPFAQAVPERVTLVTGASVVIISPKEPS